MCVGGLFAGKKQFLLCQQNWTEKSPCSDPGHPPVAEEASVPLSFTSIFTFCSARDTKRASRTAKRGQIRTEQDWPPSPLLTGHNNGQHLSLVQVQRQGGGVPAKPQQDTECLPASASGVQASRAELMGSRESTLRTPRDLLLLLLPPLSLGLSPARLSASQPVPSLGDDDPRAA